MKLLEIQIKYKINVVDPADEISDFDLDKALAMQNKLDFAVESMQKQQLKIPDCLIMFKDKLDVIEREKFDQMTQKIEELKLKNKNLIQNLNVFKRNEKYKF